MIKRYKNATYEQAQERLDEISNGLWSKTYTDWFLVVTYALTEPLCPTATFSPDHGEYKNATWGDTVPEAIMMACDMLEEDLPKWIEANRERIDRIQRTIDERKE